MAIVTGVRAANEAVRMKGSCLEEVGLELARENRYENCSVEGRRKIKEVIIQIKRQK